MKKILFGFVFSVLMTLNLSSASAAELDHSNVEQWLVGLEARVQMSSLNETAKFEAFTKISEVRIMLNTTENDDLSVIAGELNGLVYELECAIKSAKKAQMEQKLVLMATAINQYAAAGEDVEPLISVHNMMTEKVEQLPQCE